MEAAVQSLSLTMSPPHAVLLDGNQVPPNIKANHVECIIKGDSKCFSIAAASIIAKVTRDRLMHDADGRWPVYGFKTHKGYGTKGHMAAVRLYGPCPIHRLTFRPLPEIVEKLKVQRQALPVSGAAAGDS
jgi:ribonuclease HII